MTDQHSFLDDLCGVAGAVPLAPLLQGGDGGGDAAVFATAASLASQQPQAAALLVRAAQVRNSSCTMRASLWKPLGRHARQLRIVLTAGCEGF